MFLWGMSYAFVDVFAAMLLNVTNFGLGLPTGNHVFLSVSSPHIVHTHSYLSALINASNLDKRQPQVQGTTAATHDPCLGCPRPAETWIRSQCKQTVRFLPRSASTKSTKNSETLKFSVRCVQPRIQKYWNPISKNTEIVSEQGSLNTIVYIILHIRFMDRIHDLDYVSSTTEGCARCWGSRSSFLCNNNRFLTWLEQTNQPL